MEKKLRFAPAVVLLLILAGGDLRAYNPPAGGENLFAAGHPVFAMSAASSAGGAFYSPTAQSVIINPALCAEIQRVSVDAGYTGFFPTRDAAFSLGSGLQLGAVIPSRWGVFTGALQGVFVPEEILPLGNSFTLRAAFARDVTDKLFLGASVFGGALWAGGGADWALGLDAGFMYRLGTLGGLSDARVGVSLQNLGKTYTASLPGINGGESDFFPGIVTLRGGFGALFLDMEAVDAGFSAEFSLPSFQNAVFDLGAQARFLDIITLSLGLQVNLRESIAGSHSLMPSVGLSIKFRVNTGKSAFMSSKGWNASDVTALASWRQVYDGVQQMSAGVTANFGLRDADGPVISLWED
ncbi:MAG: hypothetical protein LBR23_01465 [Spirochaetaceae bacterium]|jgi:hypothetical protein|nr:hypothetical protein [Spirochaetaceae bacterium]